jgi:hypothetical protein
VFVRTNPTRTGELIAHPIRAFRLRIGNAGSQQEIPPAELPEPPSALATISALSADNEAALELALWDSVKDSVLLSWDPTSNSIRRAALPRLNCDGAENLGAVPELGNCRT